MKKIKFRAWNSEEKKMVYRREDLPSEYLWEGIELGPIEMVNMLLEDRPSREYDPHYEWMQFTGLEDKNGKEIYEGDICKFIILGDEEKYNLIESLTVTIEFRNASWGFIHSHPDLVVEDDRGWDSFWQSEDQEMWSTSYFEVIGNIYEHPELLLQKDPK